MKKILLLIAFLGLAAAGSAADDATVFREGEEGYASFRIPVIIRTAGGTLLAFCEGRKQGRKDSGDIDLVMKRSDDGGHTWGALSVVWDDKENTCGNPAPVWDEQAGKVVLVCTWNDGRDQESKIWAQQSIDTRRVFVTESADEGLSWSPAREITPCVKLPSWGWYATGPCHAIQLRKTGRLVVPCNHSEHQATHSHLIYSDDHGQTWHLGAVQRETGGNESTVAELRDGRLMLNMRMYGHREEHPCRAYLVSEDGGLTFSGDMRFAEALIEPVCQGSLLSLKRPCGRPTKKLLFCNPASTMRRENMQVKLSTDGGTSWNILTTIFAGKAAYSDMVQLDKRTVGVLFECGQKSCYEKIVFRRIKI